ncbi:MAG: 2,3,4,5-tetrahydropyridine-2,6-dicarboxylate N-succinyltransferase, partial [Acidimicrobiia bacterium]|nr:2,3,4,5-tetrahydropyridine-2,6-dicarboxylate N-succinyltransferase [Acidimicrobiia bacterium]
MTTTDLERVITAAAEHPGAMEDHEVSAVEETVELLDRGEIRLAEKVNGDWIVHAWIQQAINLYFRIPEMETLRAGPLEFYDKIPLKHDYEGRGNRVVAGGIARYGSHLEPGVVMMPSFVNIGAYVGTGTMVDTWATVGSGAQIGRRVHQAGGVGFGGVLEPPGARAVSVEGGAFVGCRCI